MLATTIFAELLRFNVGYLARELEGLTPEKYFIRPEGRANPIMWLLGHVVLNRGEMVEILGGDPRTKDLGDLFARGTRPQNDISLYPTPEKLMARFVKLAALTDHILKNCDQTILDRPSWGQFDTVGQNLAYSYMHETHHIGQIIYVTHLPQIRVPKKQTIFTRPELKKSSTAKVILESVKSVFT
jgi:hypothetical protein